MPGSSLSLDPGNVEQFDAVVVDEFSDGRFRISHGCLRQMQAGFLFFFANSTVRNDPPVIYLAIVKTMVPSVSRTFHSVRWR